VQMLADLYRRAGQFGALRDNLSRHYARHSPAPAARVAAARSETELIAAVNSASHSTEEFSLPVGSSHAPR
jgi:hypothetical protein